MRPRRRVASGWWIDESAPDLSGLLPAAIDREAFEQWLGQPLARYRNAVQERAAFESLTEEREDLKRAAQLVADTQAALRTLPLRASALVTQFGFQHRDRIGANWCELTKRTDDDLTRIAVLLNKAQRALSANTTKRGRRVATPRDELLTAVVDELRRLSMKATDARAAAAKILERGKVDVPRDDRAIRRAVGGGQKSKK